VSGADPEAASMRSGMPQISGSQVLQQVVGGVDGADYRFRCTADAAPDSQHLAVTATLRVRRR
jgi:hypothetical protein